MSIAIVSASSRSAGPWACRRPPTTSAPAGAVALVSVEDERLLAVIRRRTRPTTRPTGTGGRGRRCYGPARPAALPGAAADAQRTGSRARSGVGSRGGPRSPIRTRSAAPDLVERDFTASAPEPPVGRRFHVSALLGGRRLLQLRDRRVQRGCRRLAAGVPHAHRPGARRAADGARARASPAPTSELVAHSDAGSQYT